MGRLVTFIALALAFFLSSDMSGFAVPLSGEGAGSGPGFCVNDSPGCNWSQPCGPCQKGDLGSLGTAPLPAVPGETRLITFAEKKPSGSVIHSFGLNLVFPVHGGTVQGIFSRATVRLNSPEGHPDRANQEFWVEADFNGGSVGQLSGRVREKRLGRSGNRLGGLVLPLTGTLNADGTGVVHVGKHQMDVRFPPFSVSGGGSAGASSHASSPVGKTSSSPVAAPSNPGEQGTSQATMNWLAGLGGAGVGGYLLLHLLGLLGTKTAVGTTASTTGGMVAATSETMESVPVSASGSAQTEGMTREPSVGDTRAYLDEQGTRWVEVFNGQNWIDSATNAAQQQQVTENQSWQNEQAQRQKDHDTAFDREQQARVEESRRQLAEKQAVSRQDYKQSLKEMQELHESDQNRAVDGLARAEAKTRVMEWAKETVDFTVQAVSSFTGPAGWVVGNAYTLASDVAEGVSQGAGDAGTLSEVVAGAAKGTFNGLATGLCKVAVGETLSAAGAGLSYGLRTVQHRLVHFNPGKAPLAPLFHSSLPATELVQMAKNLSSGKSLMTGVNAGLADVGVQSFRKAVSGESFNVAKARYEFRPSSVTKLHADKVLEFGNKARCADFWGTLQGLRGIAIDDPIGQTLAENMFHIS